MKAIDMILASKRIYSDREIQWCNHKNPKITEWNAFAWLHDSKVFIVAPLEFKARIEILDIKFIHVTVIGKFSAANFN